MHTMRQAAALLLVAITAACGGSSSSPTAPTPPPPPPPAQVAGQWSGTLETANYIPLPVFVTLNQSGTTVTGTWASQTGSAGIAGNINGTVDQTTFTGTITYSINQTAGCSGSFSGTAGAATLNWSSAGFTGNCNLVAGNPLTPRFVLQRR